MTEKESLVALASFIPFGPARIKLLLKYFGSARKAWRVVPKSLIEIGLGENTVNLFNVYKKSFNFTDYFNRLKKRKINSLAFFEEGYPVNLKELDDAPTVIYVKGKIKTSDQMAIAIVGSRKMTTYGREVTSRFSSELASFGLTIVSGLARGIDTEVHKGALSVGGRTLAVLGCGLDMVYPPENYKLAEEVINNGALISEYPLGYPAKPINFASRNRIISGLAKAVLVIEGAAKSGTLLTASHAASQGKTVFAVPGQITSPLSQAPHFLIKNGANLALSTRDIMEEMNLQFKADGEQIEKAMPSDGNEEEILTILENESLHLDEIARGVSLEVGKLSARLTIMELKGLVKNLGAGVYKKI